MNRRSFFTLAGGMAGYTVAVRVNGLGAEPEPGEHITRQFEQIAPSQPPGAIGTGDPHLTPVGLEADVLVAGGGMAGVCAALAAARHGATVILVQDRSRLGGNSSSEVKMHIVGANAHGGRPGWREGGLIEELRLEDAVRNPQRSFELWDLLLYDKIKSEPNITLLLDTVVFAAETRGGLIRQVLARCDKTEHLYRIRARLFLDCTGDCRLGLEAGAEMRMGREAKSEFAESLAYETADGQTQGSSILFTARDYGRPMPFVPPRWARKVTKEMLKFRGVSSWEYGYWWIEWGGQFHSIRDNERIRFELLSIVLGVWDYIKNSGNHPTSANWALDWVGMVPGKRESRRVVGDHVLTQHDLEGKNDEPDDAVAIGGWPMDDHPPSGFDAFDQPPFRSIKLADVYSIPLRCLYSKTVGNLFMAG
ncbi:MAG TPA: FAD-dependent oxidoreductase, partial [Candidatus Paceibacterota bacterium]|nr:FAD-dependent oxidoreductase [Candidatus Paceibacterota bacterium]